MENEGNIPLDFGEMNIHCNRDNYYDCPKIGIDAVLNEKIVVLGFQQGRVGDAEKSGGERKPLILHIHRANGSEAKVFTNSKLIKEQMAAVKEKYDGVPAFACRIVKEKAKFYRLVSAKDDQ